MEVDMVNAVNGTYTPPAVKAAEPKAMEPKPVVEGSGDAPDKHARAEQRDAGPLQQIQDKIDERQAETALAKAIEQANKRLVGTYNQLQYSIHQRTRQIMIKVINSETKEIVREIPEEKTLDAIAKMWELAGILVDEKR